MLANKNFDKQINLLCKFGGKSSISYDTFGSVNLNFNKLIQTSSTFRLSYILTFFLHTVLFIIIAFKLSGDLNMTQYQNK